ncbi:MAG: hypothetical protein JJD92_12215 [Frankiaceae bacterium]|nr:hypothetical protein [Frankiaceae bacterium]
MSEPSGGWASPGGDAPPPPAAPQSAAPSLPSYGAPTPGWNPPPGWGAPGWGQPRPPEPKPGVVPLRPLGLGELLDGAVTIVRRYPRPVLGLSAVLAIVSTVLNVVLALTVLKPLIAFDISSLENGSTTSTDRVDGAVGSAAFGSLGSSLVTAIATLILTGIITVIAGRGVLGQPMTLGQAWTELRPRLWRLLGLSLLTTLLIYGSLLAGITVAAVLVVAMGAGGLVLGIPIGIAGACLAVYLYCRLALAPCAVVLEKAGVRTSLRRSGTLVRGSWWRVFGVLFMAWIVAAVVGQVVQTPFIAFGIAPTLLGGGELSSDPSRFLVLTYIGAGIAQTVITPFTSGVRALLYVDRRMRAEGLDVALTAAAAAQRVA